LRYFTASPPDVLAQVYCTFARPLLEYGTPVVNSIRASDEKVLERVQKDFTRSIFRKCRMRNLGYEHRLNTLHLESLKKRRLVFDLSLLFDVFHGKVFCPNLLTIKVNARQLSHNSRLLSDKNAKGHARLQWPQRCVSLWNRIPEKVISSSKTVFLDFVRAHF
jgi:hypothetical protein